MAMSAGAAPTAARSALACAAGLAVAAAASWLRYALERTFQLDTGTPAYIGSALLLGAGLVLAGVSAFRLARLSAGVRPAALLGWAVLGQLAAFPALALTSRDLFSNLAYGQLELLGKSPYLDGPRALGPGPLLELVTPRWAGAPSAYGPVISAVSRAAAWAGAALGSPVWGAGLAFKALMLLCVVATLLLAHAHLRTERDRAAAAERFALLAFSPLLAWELSAQAHNDAVLVLSLMAFVWAARRQRDLAATLALMAGVFAKLAAAPILAAYLVLAARRSRARAAFLALAAAGAGAVLLLPYWRGLATLSGPAGTLGGDVERHAHSLADLLALALAPWGSAATSAAYRACWVASVLLCAALALRAVIRARSLDDVVHGGLVVLLAYDLTTPWFQPWYATWLLPLALEERDGRFRRLIAMYAFLTVVQWALPLDPVSTVAVNGWVALSWWRLTRPLDPEGGSYGLACAASTIPVAGGNSGSPGASR